MSVLTDFPPGDVFVETGTGAGSTTIQALPHFRQVHTIESDPGMVAKASEALGSPLPGHLTMHSGRSVDVLTYLVPELTSQAVVFWLDAHWAGGAYSELRPDVECPLIAELAIIVAADWAKPPVVLIDDAAMLGDGWWATNRKAVKFDGAQWPSLYDVLSLATGWSARLNSPDVLELRP